MDARERFLRSIENEHIQLVVCTFEHKYQESWRVTYKSDGSRYPFVITIHEDEKISISCPEEQMRKNVLQRIAVSRIIHELTRALGNFPRFRLKLLMDEMYIHLSDSKYVIFNPEDFEERKKTSYVMNHRQTIERIFHESAHHLKKCMQNRDMIWVVKEKDEIPLFRYLVDKNYMTHTATVNGEEYGKLSVGPCLDQPEFFEHFSNELKELGYNIWYETYTHYDFEWCDVYDSSDDEYDHYEEYYNGKKKNR